MDRLKKIAFRESKRNFKKQHLNQVKDMDVCVYI